MVNKFIFQILLFISLFSFNASGQTLLKYIDKGSYSVGFTTYSEIDLTRPSIVNNNKFGRELQVNVWYPSKKKMNEAKTMSYNDYISLKTTEIPELKITDDISIDDYFSWPKSNGGNQREIAKFINANHKMWAVKDSNKASSNFPLILMMHGSVADHAFLGEYLASYGYVVVLVPTNGYLQKDFDVNDKGMESQIRDYEYAQTQVAGKFNLETNKIAVIGFSFGAQSALGLALRNPQVSTIISLDGGIGSRFGSKLIADNPFYELDKINKPILHIYNPEDSYTYLTNIKGYAYSDRTLIGLKNIDHWNFTSFGILNNHIPNLFGENKYSKTAGEASIWLILDFLNSQFNMNIREEKNKDWVEKSIIKKELFKKL